MLSIQVHFYQSQEFENMKGTSSHFLRGWGAPPPG